MKQQFEIRHTCHTKKNGKDKHKNGESIKIIHHSKL